MKKETISAKRVNEINALLSQSDLIIYCDFENIRNSQQLINELLDNFKRLQTLGFSISDCIRIIFDGGKLQERFLQERHFQLFKDYFKEYTNKQS